MRNTFFIALPMAIAHPAFAASGPFFSLGNTNFVVTISFVIFIAILLYLKVPNLVGNILDKRAMDIQSELNEARTLREEAQSILADYERKQQEVQKQADQIIANAKAEAKAAATQAKNDMKISIKRRISAAEEQIISAQASAVQEIKYAAISIAVSAAADVIAKGMKTKEANILIDESINNIKDKLH